MLPVLKTILNRLEKIEKQLGENEKVEVKIPQPSVKTDKPQDSLNIESVKTEARAVLVEAKDEAFRIKREAEEEVRKMRQESLSMEHRLMAKEENIDKNLSQF